MRKKVALCVGINDYPGTGSDLNGCINDCNNWAEFLTKQGYRVTILHDNMATKAQVTSQLKTLLATLGFGDRFVFTYSGHGSWVPDQNGDEADGRDEVICLYDYSSGGYLSDDEMYDIFQSRKFGVRVYQFSDSCFSGTLTRFVSREGIDNPWGRNRPKFLPPSHFLSAQQMNAAAKVQFKQVNEKPRPTSVLISGCSESEYSYDAYVENQAQGAFSWAALKTYKPGMSMAAWYREIRKLLPSTSYPQTPQLQGGTWQKYWRL